MIKDTKIIFRIAKAHLEKVDQLAKKLKLSRSRLICVCLNEGIAKYLEPGYKGEWQVLNSEFLNTMVGNLGNRILELENPGAGKYEEGIKAGKEIDRLLKGGKRPEAEKLLRKREKKGLYTVSDFVWLEDKEKQ